MQQYTNYPEAETFFSSMYNIDFSYPSHLHGCFEISFCEKGQFTVTLDGQNYIITEGQAILIPPNVIHSYHTEKTSAYYTLLFSRDLVADFAVLFSKKQPLHYIFIISANLSKRLIDFHNSSKTLFGQKSLLYQLAEAFLHKNTFIESATVTDDLTTKIVTYIQENLRDQITLQSLSDYLGYNYYYISKRIQKVFNMPFSTLLSQYRIAEAKILLKTGKYTISQAALLSGFGSIRTFNRVFLKITGQTPSQYLSLPWVQKMQYSIS